MTNPITSRGKQVKVGLVDHPDCGGQDNRCLIAEARGPAARCLGRCGYAHFQPISERRDMIEAADDDFYDRGGNSGDSSNG